MFVRLFVVVVVLASTALTAQETSRLPYEVPDGWTRHADGRTLLPPGGQVAVTFLPSTPFAGTGEQWLTDSWNSVRRELKLIAEAEPAPHGNFLSRLGHFQQADGKEAWVVLNTLVHDGRGEAVILFATDQEAFRTHLPTLSALLHRSPTPSALAGTSSPAPAVTKPPAPEERPAAGRALTRSSTLDDYEFIPPVGWLVLPRPDHILLSQTPDTTGCLIQILPPQPSSGDLEKDASAVFDMMYAGWQPQPHRAEKSILTKGLLAKGQEFCRLEAGMAQTSPDGRYQTEDGEALVIRAGDQIAIIAVRHRGLMAHADCLHKYETCRRFFNSLNVRHAPVPSNVEPSPADRIIGRWSMRESGAAVGEYVFAANGNYAFGGGLGSSRTTTDTRYEYLHIKTHSFSGDGSYTLAGNELTLKPRTTGKVERMRIRFERINRGGSGWSDRMCLLTETSTGPNEVRYEKHPSVASQAKPAATIQEPNTREILD